MKILNSPYHSDIADEFQFGVVAQASGQPQERLLVVKVTSGGKIVVLQISLSVELDLTSLPLPVLHVDLVSDEDDRDVLANTHDILVPLRHVTVCDSGRYVEHNNCALAHDVVTGGELI
jgi:hypothetical protein